MFVNQLERKGSNRAWRGENKLEAACCLYLWSQGICICVFSMLTTVLPLHLNLENLAVFFFFKGAYNAYICEKNLTMRFTFQRLPRQCMSFDHGGTSKIILFDAVGYLVPGLKIISIVFTATKRIWFLRCSFV